MESEDDFRPSLTEFAASLLDQLEPLSPTPARPIGVASERAVHPGEQAEAHAVRRATEAPTARERRPGGDLRTSQRRNRHRERERSEALYLQAYSHLLERRLAELQRRQARNDALSEEQREEHRAQRARADLRRALALRQRRERGESERENARLRALWTAQLQFVQQVQALAAVPRAAGPANGYEARVTFCDFDADALAALVGDLDAVYEQSSRGFHDLQLACSPEDASFHTVRVRDALGTGNIDMVDVLRVPGSFRALRELTWDAIISKLVRRGGIRVRASTEQNNNTLLTMKMRYHMTPLRAVDEGREDEGRDDLAEDWYFEVVLALRRYVVSPEREVAAWKSLIRGDGGLRGLATCETGYSLMQSAEEDPLSTTFKRVRRLESMAVPSSARVLLPTRDARRGGDGDAAISVAEVFSKLSLSAMEDDVNAALHALGLK